MGNPCGRGAQVVPDGLVIPGVSPNVLKTKWARRDLNPRPSDYESSALSIIKHLRALMSVDI